MLKNLCLSCSKFVGKSMYNYRFYTLKNIVDYVPVVKNTIYTTFKHNLNTGFYPSFFNHFNLFSGSLSTSSTGPIIITTSYINYFIVKEDL